MSENDWTQADTKAVQQRLRADLYKPNPELERAIELEAQGRELPVNVRLKLAYYRADKAAHEAERARR